MIAGGYGSRGYDYTVELYNLKTGYSCFLPSLPEYRDASVSSGLKVCGGSFDTKYCVEYRGGYWVTANLLTDYRVYSSLWESSHGPVILGGYYESNTAEELIGDYSAEEHFQLSSARM